MRPTCVGVSEPIAKGDYCGFRFEGAAITFLAPVDLRPGDQVAVDSASGQPLAIRRPGAGVILVRDRPAYLQGGFSFSLTPEQHKQLLDIFGVADAGKEVNP